MKKTCFKCEIEKDLNEFYVHKRMADGHLNKCKQCTKSDVRQRRVDNPEKLKAYEEKRGKTKKRKKQLVENCRRMREKNPLKFKARAAVGRALRSGVLTRQPCVVCGTTEKIHAHHDDYSKQLEVVWMCGEHHRMYHESRGGEVDWHGR